MIYNVYLICAEIGDEKLYKIGYTKRQIEKRLKELKTGNGADLEIIDSFSSKWGTKIESSLHRRFKSKKINGEWFSLSEKDVFSFKSICELAHQNFEVISQSSYYQETGRFH